MVKKMIGTTLLCSFLFCQMIAFVKAAFGAEQELSLKYKIQAIETDEVRKIVDTMLTIADINNDHRNEIAISGSGYMRIIEWNGKTFEPKWKSPQFSHQWGPLTYFKISSLVPASYYIDKNLTTDYLFFAYTTPKSSDVYKVTSKNNQYELQKISASPFNRFGMSGACSDGSAVIIGSKIQQNENYVVVYQWNGSVLVEKWRGAPGTQVVTFGDILSKPNISGNVFLVQDKQKTGFLSCTNGEVEWKEVSIDARMKELMSTNRIDIANGRIGFTKKGSLGELWTVQFTENDNEYNTKLYVSQFDGKKFSPFSRVYFKGVNSDMIYKIIITDVDNDGVGEILGIEEGVRKIIPRKHPQDEADTRLNTSNMFLSKWNGKEYEVKWYKKAIDEKIRRLAVADVIGNGKKEIIATTETGYLYIFEMPEMQ